MREGPQDVADGTAPRRARSRLGLFLPYALLLVLCVLWSAAWVFLRARAGTEIDAWLAREAEAGRTWTCADRALTGYPFRLELRCASLALARADGGFRLGPVTVLAQVYQPRHVLLEAAGPFHAEQGDLTGDVAWTSLRGSFHGAADGFTRASLVVEAPRVRVEGAGTPVEVAAAHLELHARPTPGRYESDGAVDVSLRLARAASPAADRYLGNPEPADLDLDVAANRATVLRTGALARELEAWRLAGGTLDIVGLSLAKGDLRLQATGSLGLDDAHRPTGQIAAKAAGAEAIVAAIVGQRFDGGRGALVGGLVGGLLKLRRPPAQPGQAPLAPLPALKLTGGRLLVGGFPIPDVALPTLY